MPAKARNVLVVALLGALTALPGAARGQGAELPVAPGPELSPPPRPVPAWGPAGLPADGPELGPPAPLTAPPPAPPLFEPVDPGRDGWGPYGPPSLAAGPYVSGEVEILHPVLRDRLFNDTPIPGTGNFLSVPSANLPWTVAPWIHAGYVLPYSYGLVEAGYRFFSVAGNTGLTLDGLPSAVHTRLNLNMIDLDYGTTPYAIGPRWDWSWRVGVRWSDVFFDSRVQNTAFTQQSSNTFLGIGPHARLDLTRHIIPIPGLSLLGRVDGSVQLGRVDQKFRDLELLTPTGIPAAGTWDQNSMQAVPTLIVQAGLGYTPPGMPNLHLAGGYLYEHWWYVGQLGFESTNGVFISNSRGEFGTQGLFVRARYDF